MNFKTSFLALFLVLGTFIYSAHNVEAKTAPAQTVEEKVREYFKETPVMIEIARCESKFSHFSANGSVLRGGWKTGMVGVFQVFESVHTKAAAALGLDITTLEGNLAYAKHLFTQLGTSPWNSSKACWGNAVSVSAKPKAVAKDQAKLIAQIDSLKKAIKELSILLEKKKKVAISS